jgi:hypothetical protein
VTIENEIARDILAYLIDNQDAQDTLEGIIQWWLLEQQIKYQTKMVKEALEELVAKELVLKYEHMNSRTRYRLNESKTEDIRRLLKSAETDSE